MSTPTAATALPILPNNVLQQMEGQGFRLDWLTHNNITIITEAYIAAYAAKEKVQDLLRQDAIFFGDNLRFTLPNGTWTVVVVPSTSKKRFCIVSVSPRAGLDAKDCDGFQEMTEKLLKALEPATYANHKGLRLSYDSIDIVRLGRAVGSLGYIRSSRALWGHLLRDWARRLAGH